MVETKGEDEGLDETLLAIEALSVSINGIAETLANLASAPPEAPETYASLADAFGRAGADISTLAAAMAVLARRLP